MNLLSVVFSKDRALQLDCTLRSFLYNAEDIVSTELYIIYTTSNVHFRKQYERLQERYGKFNFIHFIKEEEFKSDLLSLLPTYDYVLFLVDDNIFVRRFTFSNIVCLLEKNNDAIGYSLRLGKNTHYCYSLNRFQSIPAHDNLDYNSIKFKWTNAQCDFGYPLEVSSSVFRITDIMPYLFSLKFNNPNSLEDEMNKHKDIFNNKMPFLISADSSITFCSPINKVQDIAKENRSGNNVTYSPKELADRFENGYLIDIEKYFGFIPNACHQEVELLLTKHDEAIPQSEHMISVVIPCYNQAQFLAEAVESVVKQTYCDWECIIVNDGSPDNTSQVVQNIIMKYPDKNIKLIEKENEGLAAARNTGIRNARGKFILPLDSDDILISSALEDMLEVIDLDETVSLVYSDYLAFGFQNGYVQTIPPELFYDHLREENGLPYCSLYKKEVWEKVGGYNTNMIWGYEDWDFWIGCIEKKIKKVKKIPKALFRYRTKEVSMITNAIKHNNELRARMVLNHAALFRKELIENARELLSKEQFDPKEHLVSIIVPTFNRPEFLRESIGSILSQTYKNLEIVVVNDAGSDVQDLINEFKDKRIRYIKHEQNKGLAASRNTGIINANGKYIAYLDDDDVYYPDHIEALVECLKKNNIRVAYTDAYRAHQQKKDDKYIITHKDIPYSFDFDYEKILWGNFIPVLCIMHEKACLEEVGMFDEKLLSHEDWDLWIRMSRKYEFKHIKKCTCEFRWRTDGSTMTSSKETEYLETTLYIYNKYKQFSQNKPNVIAEQQKTVEWRKSLVKNKNANISKVNSHDTTLVSIIIPVFNKWEYTHRCLKTLLNLPQQISYEIIVIDNASTDETYENLRKLKNAVRVIENKENTGFTIASNQGAAAAKGKYLLFLNNDTEPLGDWLRELVELAESDIKIGAVGAKLIFPNGELQEAGGVIFSNGGAISFGRNEEPYKNVFNQIVEVDYCTGACLLVRTDLFRQFGGFDERYAPAYSEDSDLCFTLRKNGYKVLYNPNSVVIHYESITSGQDPNAGFKKYAGINWKKFVEKWKEELILQDNLASENVLPLSTCSRNRLLDSKGENKYSYRKKYVCKRLENRQGHSLAFYPTQFQQLSDFIPVNLLYDSDYLLKLTRALGFPWLYGRAYLEGRSFHINHEVMFPRTDQELRNDLLDVKSSYQQVYGIQDKILENIITLEAQPDLFVVQMMLNLGDRKLIGIDALKECYKIAVRAAFLEGIIDQAGNVPEEEAIRKVESRIEEKYTQQKNIPIFVSHRDKVVSEFHPADSSSKNEKKRKNKVLCFFPHNPYPPRIGADHGFMGMLNALRELDCELHLFSSTYFTDNPWKTKDILEFCNENNTSLYIHQADEEDHIYINMMQLKGESSKWEMKIPESLSRAFHETYLKLRPDMIIINYAWWGNIIDMADYSGTLKILQMHNLLSLNEKMKAITNSLIGKPPYEPKKIKPEALMENVFARLNLEGSDDEYEVYGKYDYVIAVSEREAKAITSKTHATKAVFIQAPIGSKKFIDENSYSEQPLFAITDNIFNVQAYCYLVSRVLPLIRKKIPEFQVNVIGDGCKVLTPAKGINLLGCVEDIHALYAGSPFAIAPMIGGTDQSVNILEAMANGLPVVSLRNSFQTSSICHEVNGFVAENAQEFAEYVIRLYKDRALCKKLGQSAKETVRKEYSQEKLVECIRPLVNSLKDKKKIKAAGVPNKENRTVKKKEITTNMLPEEALQPFIEKYEDNFVIISESIFKSKGEVIFSAFENLFRSLPPFYVHFGGAGDASLLLSTFYDDDPEQIIISFANSKSMMKSFFKSFPKLKKIYLFDCPLNYNIHQSLRYMLPKSGKCKGMGVTPLLDYMSEWNETIDIFSKYGIRKSAVWAKKFGKNRIEDIQVVLQPKGSTKGMVGSKRNMLSNEQWDDLLKYWIQRGVKPVVIGTPDENEFYPLNTRCINKRSYNFAEQMEIIASGDLFIGADSWGKTFSALCEIPTVVYPSLRGEDLKGWKDSSDYIFMDPWDLIYKFDGSLKSTLSKVVAERFVNSPIAELISNNTKPIVWEGSQFVNHSLALVNRALCLRLIEYPLDVSIIPFERDTTAPSKDDPALKIKEHYNKKLSEVNIHVRHHWPPNLNPPAEGRWVMIQPWEFGSLPKKWVEVFSTQVDELWVPSSYVRDVYISSGVPAERVFVVPNGFDEKKLNPKNKPYKLKTKKKFKFLFVGGTIFRKGIDILLEAYLKGFAKSDNVCLVIKDMGGDSFYKGQTFREKIEEIRKQKNAPEIEYIDKILSDKELAGLYTACDVLVHPYRGEGFGLPILEAMASGTPAIVTNGGACLDFCNENNSILVEAEKKFFPDKKVDDLETVGHPWLYEVKAEDLAHKMTYAVQNPKTVSELGKKASVYVHDYFTWDHAFKKMKERIDVLSKVPVRREGAKLTKIGPGNNFIKIHEAFEKKEYEEALQLAAETEELVINSQDLKESNNTISDISSIKGLCYLQMSDYERAKESFERALNLYPQSSQACRGLGEVFFALEIYDASKTMFEWAVKNDPQSKLAASGLAKINILLGLSEMDNSLFENSASELTGEIQFKNDGENSMEISNAAEFKQYFDEAFNLYQSKQYRDSLIKLYEAENYYSDSNNYAGINLVDLNVLRGTIYLLLEDLNNSRVSFEKALNLDPASSEACSGLGEILFRTGFVQEAKTMFEWAVQNDPVSSGAKNRLAKANRELGLRDDHSAVGGGGSEENEAQILVDEAYELFQNKQYSQ
ncbi:MAG: glycosyltransferase, partial [Methanococcaceae archaeon]